MLPLSFTLFFTRVRVRVCGIPFMIIWTNPPSLSPRRHGRVPKNIFERMRRVPFLRNTISTCTQRRRHTTYIAVSGKLKHVLGLTVLQSASGERVRGGLGCTARRIFSIFFAQRRMEERWRWSRRQKRRRKGERGTEGITAKIN